MSTSPMDLAPCDERLCAHIVESLYEIQLTKDNEKSNRGVSYIIKTFPNILNDIVCLFVKQATDNARELSRSCQASKANTQQLKPFIILSCILGKSPQISNMIYSYFETSSFQPLPEDSFQLTPTKQEDIIYNYPGFDDEQVKNILISYFKYLSFNPRWFSAIWNWSELGRFVTLHPNQDIKYLAACCLSIITRPSQHQHIMFLQDLIIEPTQLIELQLKHAKIVRHTSRTLFETSPQRITDLFKVWGSETGQVSQYKFCNESLTKITNTLLPKRDASQDTNHIRKTIEKTIGRFVKVHTINDVLSRIAYAISVNKPCLLKGPTGSGKTSILDYIAAQTNRCRPPDYIKVQVGDQVDSKSLVGSYVCTEIPGQFEWQAGPLTQALAYGSWIVFEDIDLAPAEMAQVIHSVIENGNLACVSCCPIKIENPHPDFKIFFTQRTKSYNRCESLKLGFGFIERLCDVVDMPELGDSDLKEILETRYHFGELGDTILRMYRSAQDSMLAANLTRATRTLTLSDLFKFCDRISRKNIMMNDGRFSSSDLDGLLIDSFDCYIASLPCDHRVEPAKILGEILNKPSIEIESILSRRLDIRDDGRSYSIGRAKIDVSKNQDKQISTFHSRMTFAHTRQSLQLLESVSLCIDNREPVLLVGETGVGKTTIVQHLAQLMTTELAVINLSQQSDSSDLLGGVRPVEMREIIKPIHEEFGDLIQKSYDLKPDEKFTKSVETNYLTSRKSSEWSVYLKLVGTLCKQSLMQPLPKETLKRWTDLSVRTRGLRKRLSDENSSPMALTFTEGTLLQAVRKGRWILLDEVNLAEPEVLQCLMLIIDSLKDSYVFIQSGNENAAPIFIHPKFRIFACMNPSTDVGKRDLPIGVRGRFTEFYVDDVQEPHDLRLIVESYVKMCLKPQHIESIVNFYREIRFRSAVLSDVSGNNPIYSLRSLCRALSICSQNVCKNIEKSLLESLKITFLQQLNHLSVEQVVVLIDDFIFKKNDTSIKQLINTKIPMPQDNHKYIEVENFWIQISSQKLCTDENYILTDSVKSNLRRISRILCLSQRRLPILIQGNTSVGKTSLIKYLARLSGNYCYRINNHEHTDLQEYVGKYVLRETGELQWQDGLLTKAMKKGFWVIFDELNLAPCELLEALNRVLDDNRELFIPETGERISAHGKFVLFATQNPPEEYAGRKLLSRAFRNRFVELHFDELPHNELEVILHKRCQMPKKYADKIVRVMKELQMFRRESICFGGKNSFMTMRDLFRWGQRYLVFKDTIRDDEFIDWDMLVATQGLILLEGRVRTANEADIVKNIIEKVFKTKLDRSVIYDSESTRTLVNDGRFKHIHFTSEFKRLYVQLSEALKYKEPVLLCGQTGCGKTTACQLYANQTKSNLIIYNCHANTESSDFVGNVRPSRDSSRNRFQWHDGPLVRAMRSGSIFLLDEISLADDAVLERINSVLEPERSLALTEKDGQEVVSSESFRIVATMNPGGDYGKKELSTALKNRFTEIYCHNTTSIKEIMNIVHKSLTPTLSSAKIAPPLLKTMSAFLSSYYCNQDLISIRDILGWTSFLNETTMIGRHSTLSVQDSLINGAYLVFFDQFGTCGHNALHLHASSTWKEDLSRELILSVKNNFGSQQLYQEKLTSGFQKDDEYVKIGKFSVRKGKNTTANDNRFIFDCQTVVANTEKIVRALQLDRPILLEGNPGSGKTSLVAALAHLTGHQLVRINLSDQTDISDLLGSDLPDPSQTDDEEPKFCWHDGPMLKAIKESSWILLDEMNLASQSVLEGLNACFDHRGEVYISELNKTIMIDRNTTRIFACQNPYSQGSARKGLPQSFINRFTSIHITPHNDEDLLVILTQLYPNVPRDLLEKMINFNGVVGKTYEMQGYEFNLRDLIYWCDLMTRYFKNEDSNGDLYEPERFVQFVYIDRMRSISLKCEVCETFEKIFGYPFYEPPYRDIKLSDSSFLMARSSLTRKTRLPPQLEDLCILKFQMPYIESISKALEFNKMPILVGDSGVGKRSMIKILAGITGNELNVVGANRDMDTIELLGSYEQKSLQREMVDLVDQSTEFALSIINSIPKRSRSDSLKRLFKHVWSTLYSTSLREHRLSKSELMEFYRFQVTQLEALIEKLNPLSTGNTESKYKHLLEMITNLKKRILFNSDSTYSSGNFEWIDSLLIKSIKDGKWLLIENANLMNPATLDRLNSLVEPNGILSMSEKGSGPNGIEIIKAHPDFRLILTMNPENGELSRAMRNRGVEIFIRTRFYYEDFLLLLNSVGLPIVEGTSCMTYCTMQSSYDAHVEFTGERPEDDGSLLAHFGLKCSALLSHQIRRGVTTIECTLTDLFIAFYRQRGHLGDFEDSIIKDFISDRMAKYKESYVVVKEDNRYKWLNFRHDLRAMSGGDAIPAMLHNERKLLKEWSCPLSIGLLKFDEMIENSDIVFCCTSIKIFMELASPSDFEYRKKSIEIHYSKIPETFHKRMLELVNTEIGSLQQECLPMITKELPSDGPVNAIDMYVDTRNSPDLHYTLSTLSYKDTISREDLQNRWILSLYRINLSMITEQIERTSFENQDGCTSLYLLSEKVKNDEMLPQDIIRPQALIASDLYDVLNGLIRFVSNRCFPNNLVVKLIGRLFWINYFSCKLKRAYTKEELIATCNQIPMLWALTYQKVVVPLIEDCELADVSLNNKRFSSRIKHICDCLDVNITKPSKIEKQYYHKVLNRYAATTKRSEIIIREVDKLFTTLISRYTIKSQAMEFMGESSAALAASNLVWSKSVYMSAIYKIADLLLEIDTIENESPIGIQTINEKLALASSMLVSKRDEYEAHEAHLASEPFYRERCLSLNKRRCGLDQFSPIWQTRLIQGRISTVFHPNADPNLLRHNHNFTKRMLRDVNGILMSPRYFSMLNKFVSTKAAHPSGVGSNESTMDESIVQSTESRDGFNMYATFLVDHVLENIVLDNQVVGWIKMRVTTSDLASSAPIMPEYSPIISLVSSYCLDITHLKLNSYQKSSPQLESLIAYLWRSYAQIKSGQNLQYLKLAQDLIHLRIVLDGREEVVGTHQCLETKDCCCLDAFARLRTSKYDENLNVIREKADKDDRSLFIRALKIIHFGFYHMLEYAPVFTLDPSLRSREKSEVYKAELAHAKIDLHLRNNLHYWKTGENLRLVDVTPEESKLYPFTIRVLVERRAKLEKSLKKLRKEFINRPKSDDGTLYYELRKEVEIAVSANTNYITLLLNDLLTYLNSKEPEVRTQKLTNLNTKCRMFIKNLEQSIVRFKYDFALYSDITTHYLAGSCLILQGMRLLYSRLEQKIQLIDMNFRDCFVEKFHKNIMPLFSFNQTNIMKSVNQKRTLYPLLPVICHSDSVSQAQSLLLRSILLQLNYHIITTPSDIKKCIPIVRNVADRFHKAWLERKKFMEEQRKKQEELYQYKAPATTLGYQTSIERQEFFEIANKFPMYDHIYHEDVESLPHNDLINFETEAKLTNLNRSVNLGMCIDVCKAHYKFMKEASLNLLGNQDLGAENNKSRDIDMNQLVRLESEILYKVIRKCISNLDERFDYMSLECHILQANELIKSLRQSQPDQLKTGSLSNSIEILDEEIFDIYHNACPSETLKFQELLAHIDERINTIHVSKLFEKQPTLTGITKLTARISSFLVTDPLMKFVTGAHALLQLLEEWNKTTPREIKMIKEADDLITLIHSWRSIELKSWRNSLHKVKRKYIDDTLCDLWFKLYEAFNDPFGSTKRLLIEKGYDEEDVMEMTADEYFYQGFVWLIKDFFETATLGDYQIRLDLVFSFAIQTRFASLYEQSKLSSLNSAQKDALGQKETTANEDGSSLIDYDKLTTYVYNIYKQYQGLMDSYREALTQEETALSTELNNEIRVVNWQGRNLWEIKNNFRISHRKLNKVMNKYLEVLRRPVQSISPHASNKMSLSTDLNDSRELAIIFEKTHDLITKQKIEKDSPTANLSSLHKVPLIISRLIDFENEVSDSSKNRYVGVLEVIEDTIESNLELIKSFNDQRAQDLIIHERDSKEVKADKLKTCRQIFHGKKFSMQMIFKNLQDMGVSYQRGLNSSQRLDGSILSLEPLRGMIQNQSRSVLKTAASLVDDLLVASCNEMYREVVSKNLSLLSQRRREDLTGDQVERIQGYSLDMVLDIILHKKNAALIYRHLMDIQASSNRLQKLREQNGSKILIYNFSRFHKSVERFNELASRTYLSLSKLDMLLDCHKIYQGIQVSSQCSSDDSRERKVLTDIVNEVHKNYSLMTENQQNHLRTNLDEIRKSLALVQSDLKDKLKNTIKNYLYSDDDVQDIQRIFDCYTSTLNLLIEPFDKQVNARTGTILGSIKILRTVAEEKLKPILSKKYFSYGKSHVDIDHYSSLAKLNIRLSKLLKQIKLASQELYKEEKEYAQDMKSGKSAKFKGKAFNHVNVGQLREILRPSQVAKQVSNCLMTLNLTEASLDVKSAVEKLAPLLSIYTQEMSRYLNVILKSMHLRLISANQLITFFTDVTVNGFGLPCKVEDLKGDLENQPTDQSKEDNVGYGEGEGKDDASKKLEFESQLDETKLDGKDTTQDDEARAGENIDAHDDGVEMTDDFEAKAEGPDAKTEQDHDSEDEPEDDERLDELEKDFDTVDQDEGQLDNELWDNEEEGPLDSDNEDDLREADQDQSIKHDEKDLMAKNPDLKEAAERTSELSEKESVDKNDQANAEEKSTKDDMVADKYDDSSSDMSVSDGEHDDESELNEDEIDYDKDDPLMEIMNQDEDFNLDDNKNENETNDIDMELSDVTDEQADMDDIDNDPDKPAQQGIDADASKDDKILGEEVEASGEPSDDPSVSEVKNESSTVDGKDPVKGNDAGDPVDESFPDEDLKGKRTIADRSSIQSDQQIKRQRIEEASQSSLENVNEKTDASDEKVQHIEKDTDTAIECIDILSDSEDDCLLNDQKELVDQQHTGKLKDLKNRQNDCEDKDDNELVDESRESVPTQQQFQSSYNTNFGLLKYISHGVTDQQQSADLRPIVGNQTDLMKDIDEILKQSNHDGEHESIETDKLTSLWLECTQSNAHLVNELCQQLQIVLQPTKMSKYQGDYKSGKRLNMRKIISYIASQYRKDKIWLRRTKPCKRTYNISIAVDNSSSMSENNCRQMTYQSLALLAKSLSIIEAGSLNVVSFGEQVKCIHDFDQPYVDAIGAQWLRELRFSETKTSYAQLLRHSCVSFIKQAQQTSSNQQLRTSVNQLLIIISDGRNVTSEESEVKLLLRHLKSKGVLVLFLIIDDLKQNGGKSIMDVKSYVKHAGKMQVVDYMDLFPFPFYVLLRQMDAMPSILGDALRQWFELVSHNA